MPTFDEVASSFELAREREKKERETLLRVARALQDVKNYFADDGTTVSGDVFQHPYFKDGIRHAYNALKEVEHLL